MKKFVINKHLIINDQIVETTLFKSFDNLDSAIDELIYMWLHMNDSIYCQILEITGGLVSLRYWENDQFIRLVINEINN